MLFSDLSPLERWLAHEEGRRSDMHKCPAGYLSVGFGFNLEAHPDLQTVPRLMRWAKHGCDRAEAVELLRRRISEKRERLMRFSWFTDLSPARQAAIECMAYQLGVGGIENFRMMRQALQHGDYGIASVEMLDSKWALSDTPERAQRVAQVMDTGVLIDFPGEPAGW